jgi:hypothetical protein
MKVIGQLNGHATLLLGKQSLVPIPLEAGCASELVQTLWRREKSSVSARNQTQIPHSSSPKPGPYTDSMTFIDQN